MGQNTSQQHPHHEPSPHHPIFSYLSTHHTPGDHPRTPNDAHGPGATQGQPMTFTTNVLVTHATPPRPESNISLLEVGTDDVNRHKHDGTQPTLVKATPSHRAGVEWTIRH
jgi:hypothetical protein